MTVSNSQLVNRFFGGVESGTASNMEIATLESGATALVGYGHAVYAYRPPEDRFKPVVFVGWKGASKSTNQHIELCLGGNVVEVDGRPGMTDVAGDPDLDVLKGISSNDRDYSTSQRSFGRRGTGR